MEINASWWRSVISYGQARYVFPINIDARTKKVVSIGDSIPLGEDRNLYQAPDGLVPVWPLRKDGSEGRWRIGVQTAKELLGRGFIKANVLSSRLTISYIASGVVKAIDSGDIKVHLENGELKFEEATAHKIIPGTAWKIPSHDATKNGTSIIKKILLNRKFPFPKSLYAVRDTLRFFVANKPNALILDFFAGSGTTLHAVNLLNAEDGGSRRCILVTNNEVSEWGYPQVVDSDLGGFSFL